MWAPQEGQRSPLEATVEVWATPAVDVLGVAGARWGLSGGGVGGAGTLEGGAPPSGVVGDSNGWGAAPGRGCSPGMARSLGWGPAVTPASSGSPPADRV